MTSALNTKFGAHTNEQRLQQTLDSIASVRQYAPTAKVAIVEMGGIPPTPDQIDTLKAQVDYYFNYSDDESVQDIFKSTDTNWDLVKNTTEVMVFSHLLKELVADGTVDKFDRIFKMSGRYQLTQHFKPEDYDQFPNDIIILRRKHSQFPPEITGGISFQFMSRLWSWPAKETTRVIDSYDKGFSAMAQQLAAGGYFDIEHMLFKYLPNDIITEVSYVGLRGLLGPNGVAIED
jgi:hypothetical protein